MDYPFYSLALSEFWLFGNIKERSTFNQDAKSLIKQIT